MGLNTRIFSELCRWEGGGGARSLTGGAQGGQDPWGFGPGGGGEIMGVRNPSDNISLG